jgi:DNA-binding response OmpR family regulator
MADAAAQLKLLIVEDDAFLQKILVAKFAKEGFAILTASDGKEGLDQIKKEKPALVLLDLIMPNMDGFDVLYAVQTDASLKSIPIIVLSNLAQDEDVQRAKDLGALDFLVKGDLAINELVRKVKETFAKAQQKK